VSCGLPGRLAAIFSVCKMPLPRSSTARRPAPIRRPLLPRRRHAPRAGTHQVIVSCLCECGMPETSAIVPDGHLSEIVEQQERIELRCSLRSRMRCAKGFTPAPSWSFGGGDARDVRMAMGPQLESFWGIYYDAMWVPHCAHSPGSCAPAGLRCAQNIAAARRCSFWLRHAISDPLIQATTAPALQTFLADVGCPVGRGLDGALRQSGANDRAHIPARGCGCRRSVQSQAQSRPQLGTDRCRSRQPARSLWAQYHPSQRACGGGHRGGLIPELSGYFAAAAR